MNFAGLEKISPGILGNIDLTGVPKSISVKKHKICSDPISADPGTPFVPFRNLPTDDKSAYGPLSSGSASGFERADGPVEQDAPLFGAGFDGYLASWVPSAPGRHTFENFTIQTHPKTACEKKTRYALG